MGLKDVREEGVRRAVGVGKADGPTAAAAEPGVGLGVPHGVVHRLLLFRERSRHPRRRCRQVRIGIRESARVRGGVGVRSWELGFAGGDEGGGEEERFVLALGNGLRDGDGVEEREPLGLGCWGVQIESGR